MLRGFIKIIGNRLIKWSEPDPHKLTKYEIWDRLKTIDHDRAVMSKAIANYVVKSAQQDVDIENARNMITELNREMDRLRSRLDRHLLQDVVAQPQSSVRSVYRGSATGNELVGVGEISTRNELIGSLSESRTRNTGIVSSESGDPMPITSNIQDLRDSLASRTERTVPDSPERNLSTR